MYSTFCSNNFFYRLGDPPGGSPVKDSPEDEVDDEDTSATDSSSSSSSENESSVMDHPVSISVSVLLPLFFVLALLLAVLSSMIYYRRKDVTVKCLCFECVHTRGRGGGRSRTSSGNSLDSCNNRNGTVVSGTERAYLEVRSCAAETRSTEAGSTMHDFSNSLSLPRSSAGGGDRQAAAAAAAAATTGGTAGDSCYSGSGSGLPLLIQRSVARQITLIDSIGNTLTHRRMF